MKYPSILATLLLTLCCERASAQVYLFNGAGTSTIGAVFYNDAPSGGTFTSDFFPVVGFVGDQAMFIPPLGPVLAPTPLINYTSAFPHVDSAFMNVDITQTPFPGLPGTTGIPWFAATASLSQVGSVSGDTASLSATMGAGFEGFMTGADPAAAALAGLLDYSVSGIIGTNPGAFASLNAVLTYTETVGGATIGTLTWNYTNSIPGFYSVPVTPSWTPNLLVTPGPLTSNLIRVNGVITLQADPSSISIRPVPEPTAWFSLFLGAAALAGQRRRGK